MLEKTLEALQRSEDSFTREDIPLLRKLIEFHRHQYYELDAPLISDEEFDRLYALLVSLEQKYHEEHAESPTQKIQDASESHFTKARHLHPMMSLDNTYNAEDLQEFETRIWRILEKEHIPQTKLAYIVEYKFDGLGIALLYKEGKLVRALTR